MTPKWPINDANMTQKWRQYDSKMTPIWLKNDSKMTLIWLKNDSKMTKKMPTEWCQYDGTMTSIWCPFDVQLVLINVFHCVLWHVATLQRPSCLRWASLSSSLSSTRQRWINSGSTAAIERSGRRRFWKKLTPTSYPSIMEDPWRILTAILSAYPK